MINCFLGYSNASHIPPSSAAERKQTNTMCQYNFTIALFFLHVSSYKSMFTKLSVVGLIRIVDGITGSRSTSGIVLTNT